MLRARRAAGLALLTCAQAFAPTMTIEEGCQEMVRKVITFLASASAGSMTTAKATPQCIILQLASPLLTLITKPVMYKTSAAHHESCARKRG